MLDSFKVFSDLSVKMAEIGSPPSYDNVFGNQFHEIRVRDDYLDDLKQYRSQEERLTEDQLDELPPLEKSQRLERLVKRAHDAQEKEYEKRKIYNMSLLQIYRKTGRVTTNILDDLLNSPESLLLHPKRLVSIFTKGDRLIYVGIVTMLFTILFILIGTST